MIRVQSPDKIRARMVFEDLDTLRLCAHFVRNAQDSWRYDPKVLQSLDALRTALNTATLNAKKQHVATMDEDLAQYARFALVTHYYEGQKFYNAAMFEAVENLFQ